MQVTIRPPAAGDAERLLRYFSALVRVDPERVERPEDVARLTVEDELRWIASRLTDSDELHALCAEVNGEIVACGEVERMKRWIERHVAEIRFGVLPDHLEAGERLVDELVQAAGARGIETLVYFHLATQTQGIELMRRAGFHDAGRLQGYYKRGATYVDRVYLVRHAPTGH